MGEKKCQDCFFGRPRGRFTGAGGARGGTTFASSTLAKIACVVVALGLVVRGSELPMRRRS